MQPSGFNGITDLHVLIIDDNIDYTNGLAYCLDNKFNIDIINDFQAAEEIITRHKYDFVFLDIRDETRNDGTAGVRLLQRAVEADPSIRVIMFSSWADSFTRKKCIGLGAKRFIEKRINYPDMINVMEQLLAEFINA